MIRLKGVRRQCRRICGMCDLRQNGRTLEIVRMIFSALF